MTVLWGKVLSALSSLRFRLLALPLLLLALLGGSVAYNSNRVIRNALHENLQSSMRQTSQILNIAISPYASNGNLGILGVFLSELLNDNQNIGLTYIAVIREDGIAQLQVGQVGKALPPPDLSSEINAAVERGLASACSSVRCCYSCWGLTSHAASRNWSQLLKSSPSATTATR
jgi:hypothetical protein